jgi:hypothetical protein
MDGALAGAVSHIRRGAGRQVSDKKVNDGPTDEQRRGIRRTTILLTLVALAIYVAFIASGVLKAQH